MDTNTSRFRFSLFLLAGILFILLVLGTTVAASAEPQSSQCVFGNTIGFSVDTTDSVIDKIIKFFYMIIQAMISVFCKIVSFAGFRCG